MQSFNTLLLGPVSECPLYLALAEALTAEGGDLQRNPRRLVGKVICPEGQKAWNMTVGNTPFRVVLSDSGESDLALGNVLCVKFDKNQHSHTMKCVNGSGTECTLKISERASSGQMSQFANQIVADLVVNDRRETYLLSSKQKVKMRHPSRARDRNRRDRHDYGL